MRCFPGLPAALVDDQARPKLPAILRARRRLRTPRLRASVVCALTLAVTAAAIGSPPGAAAACSTTPACLEASFPPDLAWGQLNPGAAASESPEQVMTVTSNQSWGVRISSDVAEGRMTEWNGSAYVATDPKVMSRPLDWALSRIGVEAQPPSYQALSTTTAAVISNQPSTCPVDCSSVEVGVRYRQVVGFADAPAGANDYRIAVTYDAGQGF
jgi:hypothetical protein